MSVTKDLMKAFLLDEKACQMHQRILKLAEQYEVYVQTNNPEGTSTTTADSEEEDAEKQNTIYTKDSVVFGKLLTPIQSKKKKKEKRTNLPYFPSFSFLACLSFFLLLSFSIGVIVVKRALLLCFYSCSPIHPTTNRRQQEDSLDLYHLSLCELQTDSATTIN